MNVWVTEELSKQRADRESTANVSIIDAVEVDVQRRACAIGPASYPLANRSCVNPTLSECVLSAAIVASSSFPDRLTRCPSAARRTVRLMISRTAAGVRGFWPITKVVDASLGRASSGDIAASGSRHLNPGGAGQGGRGLGSAGLGPHHADSAKQRVFGSPSACQPCRHAPHRVG